jgi:hypothetical protein
MNEKEKKVFKAALKVAGIGFENEKIIDLFIAVYEMVIEKGGNASVDEIVKLQEQILPSKDEQK